MDTISDSEKLAINTKWIELDTEIQNSLRNKSNFKGNQEFGERRRISNANQDFGS